MPADDLEGKVDWDLADRTEGSGVGSRVSLFDDYEPLREAYAAVSEFAPSLNLDLLSLAILEMELMSRVLIVKVGVSTL